MREIELWTRDNQFVAVVDILPFDDGRMPDIVAWGERMFGLATSNGAPLRCTNAAHDGGACSHASREGRFVYREAFAAVSFTPSPGKPQIAAPPPPPVDRSARVVLGDALAPGVADTSAKENGQQRGYVVLSDEERAKGFVRPVRASYRHVGKRPKYPLRDLTPEEQERFGNDADRFVKFEAYPPEMAPKTGRYWTERELKSGCQGVTTMSVKLAETYARDPGFYGGTFCSTCRAHFPVGADGEFTWAGTDERVGT